MASELLRIWLAALIVAGTAATARSQVVQPPRAAPIFTGTSLPDPPHQRELWTPPKTNLPEKCVSSIQALVDYGFANPRGCEYREVELPCGSVWGGGYVFKTHAWVIPFNDANDTQRFAVSWSGLVYPTVAIGESADLKADVVELLKQPSNDYHSSAPMESNLVWHVNRSGLMVCTLLLLGEIEAAEKIWETLQTSKQVQPDADPYLQFAQEFAWANYDRAVTSHMRGDDIVSFFSAQAALRLRDNIEKDAAARGLKRPSDGQGKPTLYLNFLHNIDLLLADEHRRAKTKKPERVLDLGIDKFPDQKQRIAALIRDLEEVSARQWSQPGGVSLSEDRIVQALIKEGESAVDPLIQAFEFDGRLTRSVGFGRSFHTGRSLLGVDDAAYRAICDILKVRTFGPQTQYPYHSDWHAPKRAEVAKEIRAYWNKVRGVEELDRWYQTLVDDKGTAEQWLETAKKIVAPAARASGAVAPPPIVAALLPPRSLSGEGLRPRSNPSISELLAKRAEQVAALNQGSSHRVFSQKDACEITLALAKWEPRAATSTIRQRIEQCKVLFKHEFHATHAQLLAPWMSRVCAAGMDAGDEFAANEYAQWLRNLSPKRLDHFESTGVFYALCRFPDHPELAEPASFLFLEDSPYRPMHTKVGEPMFRELVGSSLIGVHAFREMIKQELQNKSNIAATLTIDANEGSYSVNFGGHGGLGGVVADPADLPLLQSKELSLRVCDIYAQTLRRFEGSPVFEAYWPEDRRDSAIAELIIFLDRWGDCFRLLPTSSFDRLRFPSNQAQFHLAKLDHPATPDEAKQGRAIFSLQDGKSEVRATDIPMFPQMARWKTLDRFPIRYRGQKEASPEYDRAGYIWQAEEIMIDGKWQRFYGFVGNHIIAKVPAEEIEFLQKYGDDRHLRW